MSHDDPKEWFVYMLGCDNGARYTGATTDVQRRIGEHPTKDGVQPASPVPLLPSSGSTPIAWGLNAWPTRLNTD